MSYKHQQHFIQTLENEGELARIHEFVSPILEIAEITDRIIKVDGKALLFENNGTEFPLLINAMGSEKRMCLALGVNNLDDVGNEMETIFQKVIAPKTNFFDKLKMLPLLKDVSSYLPKSVSGKGECQQVVMQTPDLTKLPILKCWPHDGGLFITMPVVHTIHPISKVRNQGMYRMQVVNENTTGMHWHLHKGSAHHFDEYKKAGITKMPVVVTLGGDPVYTYVATAPLPDNVDEYILAGFIRKKKVQLVKCLTCDLEVPSDVDFVLEGYVDTSEEPFIEGPFGDHTGYYSLPDLYPKFHITCISHKKGAVYPTTIVGIPPQEDAWIGKATERIFITPIRLTMLPEIIDMDMPIEGVFHNIAIVKIKNSFHGNAAKVMNSLWGAGQMMFNKMMVVVNENVTIHNYLELVKAISNNVDNDRDIYISKGPLDALDHSGNEFAFGGKIGIDATTTKSEIIKFDNSIIDNLTKLLLSKHPEILAINDSLLKQNISVLIVSVKKNRPNHISILHEAIVKNEKMIEIKFIVYLDFNVDVSDLGNVVWRFSNNTDAYRDIYRITGNNNRTILGINGTSKNKNIDGFKRDWPNILVSDEDTIKSVDEKWPRLGIGEFIPSPSIKYRSQLLGNGFIAKEKE